MILQFNEEASAIAKAEEEDRKFAQAVAASVHEISDSGSEPDISVVGVSPPTGKPVQHKPGLQPTLTKQNSSLHTISDSDDETQEVVPKVITKPKKHIFSFMSSNSDKEKSDDTLDLSSDESMEQSKPSTSKTTDSTPKTSNLLKKASSSIHEISDSGEESDSIISPSPSKSKLPVRLPVKKSPSASGLKRGHSIGDSNTASDKQPVDETGGKPKCKFGKTCYRRNPSHRKQFWHPGTFNFAFPFS